MRDFCPDVSQKRQSCVKTGQNGERTRPRVRFPAPSLETSGMVALRKKFDGGVEHDSRGRLCSPFAIRRRRREEALIEKLKDRV